MVPKEDSMVKLLVAFEDTLNDEGWDEPAKIAQVFWRTPALIMMEVPVAPGELAKDPADGLATLSYLWERDADTDRWLKDLNPIDADQVAALAFACEAWEEPDDYDGPLTNFADVVGSREIRMVSAADCGGRLYYVRRRRGEQPEVYIAEPGTEWQPQGIVPAALFRMIKAMMRYAPGDSWDVLAVNQMLRTALGKGS